MKWEQLLIDVRDWSAAHGIALAWRPSKPEQAGSFDGVSVTLNADYSKEEQTYYLAHALGSIVLWSLNRPAVQSMFDELRAAKDDKANVTGLERAIGAYRDFETESSELGAGVLAKLGYGAVIPPYSNFMRADLEALTEFHRTGKAPVWREFFARWNEEVKTGCRRVKPFCEKAPPAFTPLLIERQEILQKQSE